MHGYFDNDRYPKRFTLLMVVKKNDSSLNGFCSRAPYILLLALWMSNNFMKWTKKSGTFVTQGMILDTAVLCTLLM